MPVWNMKLFLLLSGLTASEAFLTPRTKCFSTSSTLLFSRPDQWLGSSPSDHYGGAVGPKFEAFEEQQQQQQQSTMGIAALDWNGGTMEAGFQKELEKQEQHLAKVNEIYPTKEQVAAEQQQAAAAAVNYEAWKQQESRIQPPVADPKPKSRVQISPLSWDGGSMEAAFEKAQKTKSGGADAPFASKSIYKTQEFTSPRYATPTGKPKMIGYQDTTTTTPAPAAEPKRTTPPVSSSQPSNGNVHQNSVVRLPPMEGIPQAKFSSRPDQPGDWFYHDVPRGERRPAWPAQSYARRPPPKPVEAETPAAPAVESVSETRLKNTAAEYEEAIVTSQTQPKSIASERPPAVDPQELLKPQVVAAAAAAVPEEPKVTLQEVAPEAPLYEQWKEQGKAERRKPPMEGIPQARFSSRPDQPGDWFYHDVPESQSRRPKWPVQSYARRYERTEETVGYQSVNLPPKEPKSNHKDVEPEPYAAKENTRKPQDYAVQNATPAGQPKIIGFTKPPQPQQPLPAAVPPQPVLDAPEGVTTGGDILLTYDHWKSQGRTQKTEKLPPAEGMPIAKFTSTPDQPGEWFYDDVSDQASSRRRPSWPNPAPGAKNRPDSWFRSSSSQTEFANIKQQPIPYYATEPPFAEAIAADVEDELLETTVDAEMEPEPTEELEMVAAGEEEAEMTTDQEEISEEEEPSDEDDNNSPDVPRG